MRYIYNNVNAFHLWYSVLMTSYTCLQKIG